MLMQTIDEHLITFAECPSGFACGGNGGGGRFVMIKKPQRKLGPNQLQWLRENLIHNGVAIFALFESQRSRRVNEKEEFHAHT